MDNQELFELRKKSVLSFSNPGDLIDFLENLFIEEVKFPLVVGYDDFNPDKEWKVMDLYPKDVSDSLTLRNYREGLRNLNKKLKHPQYLNDFEAFLTYNGIESNHYSSQDTLILGVNVGIKNSTSFNLHLYKHKGYTYGSQAEINKNSLDKIMEPFIGPVREYKPILI